MPSADEDALYARCREHLLIRLADSRVGEQPFHHLFLESVFPPEIYAALRTHMLTCKSSSATQERLQDNPNFINRRFNLLVSSEPIIRVIRRVFSDRAIITAIASKFYISPVDRLVDALSIHGEFEYVFTGAGRFQNIHVDIPPKFLSFVFYIPEADLPAGEQGRNATILYDKDLTPHFPARFIANSVCIFAPHFYSYHGFHSTMERDVLVMFYVNERALMDWNELRREARDDAPFTGLLDSIENKLAAHALIEYGADAERIRAERALCRVNAARGRVVE